MDTQHDPLNRLVEVPLGRIRVRHARDESGAMTIVEVIPDAGARLDGVADIKIVCGESPSDAIAQLIGAAQSAASAAELAFFGAEESEHADVFSAYGKILSATTSAEQESRRLAHAIALARHLRRQVAPPDFALPDAGV